MKIIKGYDELEVKFYLKVSFNQAYIAESIKITLLFRESCSPTIMTKNYKWETKNRMTTLGNKIAQGGDNRVLSPIDFFFC